MGKVINRNMILGLPVICQKTGKRLGIVENVQHDSDWGRITGIIVTGIGYESKNFAINLDRIQAIGHEAIMVRDDCIGDMEKRGQNHIIGKSVIGNHGQELGSISDIIFDSKNGQIEGYEISKGIIDDLIVGRNILSGDFLPYSDGDVVVIPMEGNIELKSNKRGIVNILLDS